MKRLVVAGIAIACIVPLAQSATAATAPGAPSNVSAVPGNSVATINWSAPTSNGGSPITMYLATAYITPGSQSGARSCTSTGATTCQIGGLINGVTYIVTVVAGNPGYGAATAPVAFTPIGPPNDPGQSAAPIINSVNPAQAPAKGGTRITIRGSKFTGVTRVTFSHVKGTNLVVVSPTKIRVTVPAGKAGPSTIRIKSPGGIGESMLFAYE
jgi:hypothetical protein